MVIVPAPVLVVEDDHTIRDTVFLVLNEEGFTVQTVEHGAAALRRIRAQAFGLILLDMQTPVMDGWTFAAAYRSLFIFHAPLVVMSAAPDGPVWAEEVHADAYIAKPFDFDSLIGTVNRLALPASGTR
jgi:CheY-like chemotaxis protein